MNSKTVVLSGAARGLGYEIAKKFRDASWNVAIFDLILGDETGIEFIQCDVSDFDQTKGCIERLIQKRGSIDALINCMRYRNSRENQDPLKEWKKAIEVNFHAYFYISSIVCEHMKKIGTGCSIVNISSVLSELVSLKESLSYHASKAAMNQMIRYLAVQFGPDKIRVNGISPGLISHHEAEFSSRELSATLYSKLANYVPLQRSGSPQEIADLAIFLASSQSSFITGQNITIDGGLAIREQLGILLELENVGISDFVST